MVSQSRLIDRSPVQNTEKTPKKRAEKQSEFLGDDLFDPLQSSWHAEAQRISIPIWSEFSRTLLLLANATRRVAASRDCSTTAGGIQTQRGRVGHQERRLAYPNISHQPNSTVYRHPSPGTGLHWVQIWREMSNGGITEKGCTDQRPQRSFHSALLLLYHLQCQSEL